MYNHDPAPPANPPLPDRPLDRLQVEEARHVLLHVAQQSQGLRTSLSAMFARNEMHQLVTTERVTRNILALAGDLTELVTRLGVEVKRDIPPVHFAIGGGRQCGREIFGPTLVTSYPDDVTCGLCLRSLRAQARER